MIKRKYFLSVKKGHGDGNGSYSFISRMATHKSWLADPGHVFAEMIGAARKDMEDKPGEDGALEVVCFTRV